ncbi:GSCOCT00014150001.2-RA-CDS [Cotesia congregata]|uniref:Cc_odve66_21 n=1 Tax=Cotesia congregata TaxID=51543 RepID=A0A8J2EE18_COTCN|nr:GSCOCT00014150001.2-RA-CDS [Cotesia congregata]CAG5077171.1 Cc_odve66_21 [Cotesia congregata]
MIANSRRSIIFISCGLIAAILVSTAIVIWIYQPQSNSNNNRIETVTKDKIKTLPYVKSNLIFIKYRMKISYIDKYNLSDNDIEIKGKVLNDTFEDDLTQEDNLREICAVGIKLLRNYLLDPKITDYLTATGKIVDKVLTQTNSINASKTFGTDKEWELYIVDIPHLMAMYDLIVEEDSSNTNRLTECHKYINRVITSKLEPACSKSTPSKIDFIKISTPYLLMNYKRSLKDETCVNLYEEATKNKNLELLNRYLSYDTSEDVKQKHGVFRVDGDTMFSNKQAEAYKCFVLMNNIKYKDLYIAVYETLDLSGNVYKSYMSLVALLDEINRARTSEI